MVLFSFLLLLTLDAAVGGIEEILQIAGTSEAQAEDLMAAGIILVY